MDYYDYYHAPPQVPSQSVYRPPVPVPTAAMTGQGGNTEQWLATVGDIAVSQHWVMTPNGTYPIRGSVWAVTDMTHYSDTMSPMGIALAVLSVIFLPVFGLLGLLFLMMREHKLAGYAQVTVQGNGFSYATLLPPGILQYATQFVNYAQSLAIAA